MNLRWIIYALIAILMIGIIWRNEFSNLKKQEWTRCKESLIQQIFFKECTPTKYEEFLMKK